jgi:hydrogenase maturation protease
MKPARRGKRTAKGKQTAQGTAPRATNHQLLATALIIGYGNPLRSDDALGWHASRLLAGVLKGADVEVITCHQLTPELAEPLSRCQRAVFIDADAQGEPGEIHCRIARFQASTSATFTHNSTPSGLLASARQLYGHRPKAIIITVTAASFEFGDALSPVIAAALPKVVEMVCQWLSIAPA